MANYQSAYTGAQIDNAVGRTAQNKTALDALTLEVQEQAGAITELDEKITEQYEKIINYGADNFASAVKDEKPISADTATELYAVPQSTLGVDAYGKTQVVDGAIKSVESIEIAKSTIPLNASAWEQGYWNYGNANPEFVVRNSRITSKKQFTKTALTFVYSDPSGKYAMRADGWNANGAYLGANAISGWFDGSPNTKQFTVPANSFYAVTIAVKGDSSALAPSSIGTIGVSVNLADKVTIHLDSALNGVGGVADEYSINDGKIVRRFANIDLPNQIWHYSTASLSFYTDPIREIAAPINTNTMGNILCNRYTTVKRGSSGNWNENMDKSISVNRNSNGVAEICVRDSAYTDVSSFVASLVGVETVAEKATPTTETVEPVAIKSLDTMPTVVKMNADGKVTFNHDTKHYIDSKIADLFSAMSEV